MKAIWAEKIDSHKVHNSHISLPINGCFSYFIYWDPKTCISLIVVPKHKFLFPFPQPKEGPMWRLDKNALIPKYMAGNWDSCADT